MRLGSGQGGCKVSAVSENRSPPAPLGSRGGGTARMSGKNRPKSVRLDFENHEEQPLVGAPSRPNHWRLPCRKAIKMRHDSRILPPGRISRSVSMSRTCCFGNLVWTFRASALIDVASVYSRLNAGNWGVLLRLADGQITTLVTDVNLAVRPSSSNPRLVRCEY